LRIEPAIQPNSSGISLGMSENWLGLAIPQGDLDDSNAAELAVNSK